MEFRILGPLEAFVEERRLELGGSKQRQLLAILLLHANEVVSADTLIDGLWGAKPPASAAKGLQVHLSRLRKALERDDLLVTRSGGYALQATADEIDASRFELLAARGRERLAAGDVAGASADLHESLRMWHGAPLADFTYESFAQAEIARLEELRLAAVEDRTEADLAAGRGVELVGELQALVAEHPLRERLRAQLMVSLYRSGRQAEALASYQDARRALVEELGLEPSRQLQDLEQAILRHDSTLEVEGNAGGQPAASVPVPERSPAPVSEPMAERKLATVLIVDLVGSAGLGEQDPERARALLERYYDAVAAEIEGAGGTLEKFAGEAVLATFGAAAAQEDHVERALHASLAVCRRCDALFRH